MGIFDGWALISDLDGTMVDENWDIPKGNAEAVRYFEENGGKFIMATGRSVAKALLLAKKLGCNYPSVVYNGAAIYDFKKEEFLMTSTYHKAHVADYFEKLHAVFPESGMFVHGRTGNWVPFDTAAVTYYAVREQLPFERVPIEKTEDEWFKVLLIADEELTGEIFEYCQKGVPEGLRVTRSGKHYCEFLTESSNKFSASSVILEMLGVPLDKSCGIGDYYNDIELITKTAIGACPADSPEAVKAVSPLVVAPCGEGAVADFVNKIEEMISKNGI